MNISIPLSYSSLIAIFGMAVGFVKRQVVEVMSVILNSKFEFNNIFTIMHHMV